MCKGKISFKYIHQKTPNELSSDSISSRKIKGKPKQASKQASKPTKNPKRKVEINEIGTNTTIEKMNKIK